MQVQLMQWGHGEEPQNMYPSVLVIKSRRIRLVIHVVRMREMRNEYKIFVGQPK
jgi:hypothetical protein